MATMQHRIDWSRPAKLIRGNHVNQFGDGYRQVSGPTIAEGSVDDLLALLRAMSPSEVRKTYICNESGNPLTIDEIEQQAAERDQS